jgi:methyl-accepting chemotaxis protein
MVYFVKKIAEGLLVKFIEHQQGEVLVSPSTWNLKTKLLLLCVFISSISICVGAVGYFGLKGVVSSYTMVTDDSMANIIAVDDMFLNYRRVRITLRTLGIKGITKENADKAIHDAKSAIADYNEADKSYQAAPFSPGEREKYEAVQKEWKLFQDVGTKVISLYESGDPKSYDDMVSIFFNECPKIAAEYTAAMKELIAFHKKNVEVRVEDAHETVKNANTISLTMIIAGLVGGLTFGYLFATSLSKSLFKISSKISKASEATASGGAQLSNASSMLSSGSSEAAASLEETVASIEELTSMVKMNSGNAQQANVLSQSSREAAEKGAVEIAKLISSMSDIANDSQRIAEIINVIDDIAFQTNLLALNAAVEAARAGDQGKGFAVVADAVRSLAQRSADAAKEISGLITENVQKSENGARIANVSGAVLKDILGTVKKVADLNSEIAAGSSEQTTGLEQISKAMNQLDQATQGNAAASEEVAASSEAMAKQGESLSELADDLKHLVNGKKKDAA